MKKMNVFSVLLLFWGNVCVVLSIDFDWISSIYPGTKWCGGGDKAGDYDDLGNHDKLDKCCRAHDKCAMSLEPNESGWGLTNYWVHTRSSCDCDDDFRGCLKSVSGSQGKHAYGVGFVYFQILHPKCIEDYHPLKCKKKIWKICYKWTTDKSKTKYKWQSGMHWFGFLNGK